MISKRCREWSRTVLILGLLTLLFTLSGTAVAAAQDVLTWHNNNARTGANVEEKILTPQNVNPKTFGKLFVIPVDGKVDAEPLYTADIQIPHQGRHNVLYVATENDSVYAFDADSGKPLWHVRLLEPGETPSGSLNCSQVIPIIGITATPVIDLNRGPHGTIYVVAMSKDSNGNYFQRLHALDLTTGAKEFGGPTTVHATYPGNGAVSRHGTAIFQPRQHEERAALLLLHGTLYTSWSSHCDNNPYNGWVIGYNERSLKQTSVLDLAPNGEETSVWQSGAGPATDSQGNMYILAANGTFDTALNSKGFPSQDDFGNAFLKISTLGGQLSIVDYFAMFNVTAENNADADLGSGGPLVLPDMRGESGKILHLAVGAGKDRNIYLVNRENMGKFNPHGNQAIYQEVHHGLGGREFAAPAYFDGRLYYGAVNDFIREFRFENARLISKPVSQTTMRFIYPGATPSISADGTHHAIVWASENGDPAVLRAFDAGNLAHELYNSNEAAHGRDHFGNGNKFITPLIAHGKVYVGTTNGVGVFGLLRGRAAGTN
jgi:outer membrane protein assembly factor BamB